MESRYGEAGPGKWALVACLFASLGALATAGNTDDVPVYQRVASVHSQARQQVLSKFKYDPDLLCRTATVAGFMKKEALERSRHEYHPANYHVYRTATIPVRQKNVLWVSKKHKLIYLRAHKSSSTSVTDALVELFCNWTAPPEELKLKATPLHRKCHDDDLKLVFGPLDDPDIWKDYFVFTFVRNPWTRAASVFSFFNDRLGSLERDKHGEPCTCTSFLRFTENTESYIKDCAAAKCRPFGVAHENPLNEWLVDLHFNDQSHSVFTTEGKCMVDFIGRTEHYTEDWAAMWKVISARNGREYKTEAVHHNIHETPTSQTRYRNTCGADRYEEQYNETTMLNIARHYAVDLVRFGYI